MSEPIDIEPPRPAGIDSLAVELAPPPALESRVMAALGRAGALRRARSPAEVFLGLAAAGLLLAIGASVGVWWSRPAAAARPAYLLLLYPGRTLPSSPADEAATAGEYAAWAARLRADGRRVSGERLAAGVAVVPSGAGRVDVDLQGFFLVSAASLDDATRLAADSPHASRGGTVVVRAVDTPR